MRFSPREYLKARSPERFSDSVVDERSVLDRSLLEYHLGTLTSRGQEADFQRFAFRLAQKEICPNLLPQTGPTGGGDSKVDAETYPVGDDLSFVWYVGIGTKAGSERWAFAFSAKKDWRAKVRSDIEKIAATDRGYVKAFFITNQFVPDRVRGEVEDGLRKKLNLDVRIRDLSWILDRVFIGRHEELAIQELELKVSLRTQVRSGPLDIRREKELEEVERRIKSASEQGRFGFQLVHDCISAATLARSLDRPRTELEGLFARAKRVTEEHGTPHQRLVSIYQWAWTAFWWFEDYGLFATLYGQIEEHAKGSSNAYDLELLTNLWHILHSLVKRGDLNEAAGQLEARTAVLVAELERLMKEDERPSTALQAQCLRLQMRLLASRPEDLDEVLRGIQEVVLKCKGLVGFPLDPLVKIVAELGHFLDKQPAYAELFQTVVKIASERDGELSAGRMLLKRGTQQIDMDRPYEAIRTLGTALGRLCKHESRHELVRALYLCGSTYARVGLLWAARGTVLTAAAIAINDFWTYADVTPLQAACYKRMKWIELQIGRIPQVLEWHRVDRASRNILADRGYNVERLNEDEMRFDAVLGLLLLRTDAWHLKYLSALPDVLDKLGLPCSAIALRFALGYEEEVPDDLVKSGGDSHVVHDFFVQWRDQPAGNELPPTPLLYEERTVTLSSNVLGCRITAYSDNVPSCVALAESVLAALESLVSTGMVEGMMAQEPALSMNVRKSEFAEVPFSFEMRDSDGKPDVQIQCGLFEPHALSRDAQAQLRRRLFELLAKLLPRVFLVEDWTRVIDKLFGDDLALERSLDFTGSFVALANVLGPATKFRISSWTDADARDYPLRRSTEWDMADRRAKARPITPTEQSKLTQGKGDAPLELRDTGRIKHTQIETVSLIRVVLWQQATWSATAFAWLPGDPSPPVLAPVFKNAKAAAQIFAHWRKELGDFDVEERLRVSIIRGFSKKKPYAYRVVIGTNLPSQSHIDVRYLNLLFRINRMDPSSDWNLVNFLGSYKKIGRYVLAHALEHPVSKQPELILDGHIVKRELHVRNAWEIGRNDPDSIGILEDDDPIVPPGSENPPVVDLLHWKQNR